MGHDGHVASGQMASQLCVYTVRSDKRSQSLGDPGPDIKSPPSTLPDADLWGFWGHPIRHLGASGERLGYERV